MEMSFRIEDGIVRMVQAGEFDVETFVRTIVEVVADPTHRSTMPVIVDVSAMLSQVNFAGMEKIREALVRGPLTAFRPRRYAIVTSAPMYDVMAKLYTEAIVEAEPVLAGGIEIRNFATMAQAEAWARKA